MRKPYRRVIAIQKAKAACKSNWLYGRAFKGQGAHHSRGQGAQKKGPKSSDRSEIPQGQGVQNAFCKFGKKLAAIFFPHRSEQASAAFQWVLGASQWQDAPWYGSILNHFKSLRTTGSKQVHIDDIDQGPNALFQVPEAESPMVGGTLQQSQGTAVNKIWSLSRLSHPQQVF